MIRSMTAFAREQGHDEWGTASWELRSVNYRYLDVSVRLPEELRPLDPIIRERVGSKLNRGKIECALRFQARTDRGGALSVNLDLVRQLAAAAEEIRSITAESGPTSTMEVLRWPGVVEAEMLDPERVAPGLLALFDTALRDLIESREREGEKLGELIGDRCARIEPIVARVKERIPAILEAQRERIRTRLAEIRAELDTARLEQEMVLIAQKVDVAEELDRLETHVGEVRRILTADDPVGRRLDFLMQELNREANTLGSKSADAETTGASVELKVLIEQMREQIQNIE